MQFHCAHCDITSELAPDDTVCPSCGSVTTKNAASTQGWTATRRRFGRFELREAVGTGAFGTVYEARDTELDRTVAIKMPRTDRVTDSASETERFLREARSVAQFRHPSIVSIYDVGQQDGVPYLVEDFVHGITLGDLLTSERLAPRAIAELVANVADALHYAHERGVIHRDVKPSNIMLERGPQGEFVPKLMDFGLAKREGGEATLTTEGQILGTPAYMSPEQARGDSHRVDGRSDVYSLGAVFYQLLTGQMPFKGNARMLMHHVLHDEPMPPRKIDARVPADLETICLRAMAKESQGRYGSAAEFRDDLKRWLTGEPIHARPVSHLERIVKWCRRRPELAALVCVSTLLALATVTAVVILTRPQPAPERPTPPPVAPVADTPPTEVERLFNALVKPVVKVDLSITSDSPMHLGRPLIPASLLHLSVDGGKPRFHDGPLYWSIQGTGSGHVLDLSDQMGQAGQITHFGGDMFVIAPYLLFLGNLTSDSHIYITGGAGFSILAPMVGGIGSKHIEFDGTHFLMPKLSQPTVVTTPATDAERTGLRNPDLIEKFVIQYELTKYVIFARPGTKVVPGDHEKRKQEFPAIYDIIELDRRRQPNAVTISNAQLQNVIRKPAN